MHTLRRIGLYIGSGTLACMLFIGGYTPTVGYAADDAPVALTQTPEPPTPTPVVPTAVPPPPTTAPPTAIPPTATPAVGMPPPIVPPTRTPVPNRPNPTTTPLPVLPPGQDPPPPTPVLPPGQDPPPTIPAVPSGQEPPFPTPVLPPGETPLPTVTPLPEVPYITDIAITKTVDQAMVVVGAEVIYTMIVQNIGAVTAYDVVVRDPVPVGMDVLGITSSRGAIVAEQGTVIAYIGTLDPDEAITITLRMRVRNDAPAVIENVAMTTTTTPETTTTNNQSRVQIVVGQPVSLPVSLPVTAQTVSPVDAIPAVFYVGIIGALLLLLGGSLHMQQPRLVPVRMQVQTAKPQAPRTTDTVVRKPPFWKQWMRSAPLPPDSSEDVPVTRDLPVVRAMAGSVLRAPRAVHALPAASDQTPLPALVPQHRS